MRRRYRNRSIFGLVFWTLLLGSATFYAAWKFDWLSIDLADVVAHRAEPAADAAPSDATQTKPAPPLNDGVAVDRAVFTEQQEPGGDLVENEPDAREPIEPATSARLRMLQQRRPAERMLGSNQTAAPPISDAEMPRSRFPAQVPAQASDPASDWPPQNSTFRNAGRIEPADDEQPQHRVHSQGSAQVIQASNEETQVLPAEDPNTPAGALQAIDRLLESGDVVGAHRELSKIYWSHPEGRAVIRDRIERTAHTIYFSPQPHFLEPYVVQPEDQFAKFAKMYDVPWQYLAKLNRVDPQRIRPGQKLKVIRGPFSAVVELGRYEMTVHAHGYYVRRYAVGIGKQGTSPVGKFRVLEKVVNPQYTDPEGRVIDADDPSNPLGERWIDLGDGYGIHGTIDPDSIGRAESRGCIRLRNEDVEDVYDLLGVGSEVVIRP